MAASYAVWHGPDGLRRIALKCHALAALVRSAVTSIGHETFSASHFDTVTVSLQGVASEVVHREAARRNINLNRVDADRVGISIDESITLENVVDLLNIFVAVSPGRKRHDDFTAESVIELAQSLGFDAAAVDGKGEALTPGIPENMRRTTPFLEQAVFNSHQTETDMLRYLTYLQSKDLSLAHAIIPLGSCTMKLNPTTTMIPLTWPEFSNIHPLAPRNQSLGYAELIRELSHDLAVITGLPAVSLQPNSGAAGEYAGLSVIRAYHHSRGDQHRDICLIPVSAHGTNPASAVMAGMKVVAVKVQNDGTLDLADLREKAEKHADNLAAFMVTYPSTYGIFESGVREACDIIHQHGGQVYLDGANMNAQVGMTNPAIAGADVCHLNLHKTLAIPHGGGGPGVGPICAAEHLRPFMPGHPLVKTGGDKAIGPVSSAPWGSASILLISWAFIKMLGGRGLTYSSQVALLAANYCAWRLKDHYALRYVNDKGRCAHEFLLDLAEFDKSAGLKVMDFAKRLQDFSIHPPTCSWPLTTAMLIEPTESESLRELDRFCDAMIAIRKEADAIASGEQPRDNNVIRRAPHPITSLLATEWDRPYSREAAAYPDSRLRRNKMWPSTSRIDDAWGDRNLVCECPTVEELAQD